VVLAYLNSKKGSRIIAAQNTAAEQLDEQTQQLERKTDKATEKVQDAIHVNTKSVQATTARVVETIKKDAVAVVKSAAETKLEEALLKIDALEKKLADGGVTK